MKEYIDKINEFVFVQSEPFFQNKSSEQELRRSMDVAAAQLAKCYDYVVFLRDHCQDVKACFERLHGSQTQAKPMSYSEIRLLDAQKREKIRKHYDELAQQEIDRLNRVESRPVSVYPHL